MISVIEVYNAVRDLANKDQKGFVTPQVFNSFASIAQIAVYNSIFEQLAPAHTMRNRGNDAARGDSALNGVKDDLAQYVREEILDGSSERSLNDDNNLFAFPSDFKKMISLRVANDDRTSIALVYDPEKIGYIMGSHLSSPAEQYPVALVADSLEVFPSDINSVVMTYYRTPCAFDVFGNKEYGSLPKIVVQGTENVDGMFVIDPANTKNFDLPSHYREDVINEIARMVGVRLRDPNLLAQAQ